MIGGLAKVCWLYALYNKLYMLCTWQHKPTYRTSLKLALPLKLIIVQCVQVRGSHY